jgi:hypothetical protein
MTIQGFFVNTSKGVRVTHVKINNNDNMLCLCFLSYATAQQASPSLYKKSSSLLFRDAHSPNSRNWGSDTSFLASEAHISNSRKRGSDTTHGRQTWWWDTTISL